jgi:DedD protein
MNQALRQRILGLLVLVALASVVLPLILDFGGDTQIDTRSQLPPAPRIQPTPLPEPASTEPQAPAAPTPAASDSPDEPQLFQLAPGRDAADAGAAATDASATDASSPSTPDVSAQSIPEEPGLDAEGLPASWVLQAGAFQDKINADELRGRLLKGGHRAFVQTSTVGGKATHRVFVGPKMTREALVAEQAVLQRKFGVKTMIVPFVP